MSKYLFCYCIRITEMQEAPRSPCRALYIPDTPFLLTIPPSISKKKIDCQAPLTYYVLLIYIFLSTVVSPNHKHARGQIPAYVLYPNTIIYLYQGRRKEETGNVFNSQIPSHAFYLLDILLPRKFHTPSHTVLIQTFFLHLLRIMFQMSQITSTYYNQIQFVNCIRAAEKTKRGTYSQIPCILLARFELPEKLIIIAFSCPKFFLILSG
ncbi:hypothetical protein PPYR_10420 [Photinus pyralis]|uniref:Uncharacterized protein n=1 Tax=Photinus pyralis TaxID=7054 RepID=A0A5N4AGD1_PHOPY|nr:hypothetical protein PPYR_10420 [Photinus pyralis]